MLKLINEIKYKRLPERFFIEMVKGVTESDSWDADILHYQYKGKVILDIFLGDKNIYVSYDEVWKVFLYKYKIEHDEIIKIVKRVLDEYTHLKGYTIS